MVSALEHQTIVGLIRALVVVPGLSIVLVGCPSSSPEGRICQSDDDCGSDARCVEGACEPTSTDATGMDVGDGEQEAGDPDAEDAAEACPPQQERNPITGDCERRSCTEDGDCADTAVCSDGECFARSAVCEQIDCERGVCAAEQADCVNPDSCEGDSDCLEDYYCGPDGTCLENQCVGTCIRSVCEPSTGECVEADACTEDGDCPRQHYCEDETCVENTDRWTCENPVVLEEDGQTFSHNTMNGRAEHRIFGASTSSEERGEIVYELELSSPAFIKFSISPTGGNTGHAIGLREACNDWESRMRGTNSDELEAYLESGTYYILVGGDGNELAGAYSGTFEMQTVECTSPRKICVDEDTLVVCDSDGNGELDECRFDETCDMEDHRCK